MFFFVVTFYFMYGYCSLKQRITCLFNWFRSYNKIASKGCVGGLKWTFPSLSSHSGRDRHPMPLITLHVFGRYIHVRALIYTQNKKYIACVRCVSIITNNANDGMG